MFGTTDTSDAVASALKRPYDPAESDVDTADIHVPPPGTPAAASVPPGFVGPSMNAGDQAAAEANDVSLQKLRAAARLDAAANMKTFKATSDLSTPSPSVPNNASDVAGIQSTKPDASQLPSLDPQGPKNGILHALLRATGFVGDNPKPGELYNGPTTTDQKIHRGFGLAGAIGNALAAAAGTPQQQEIAEKRSEFGPELKQKGDLARATLDSLSDYRQGRVQNAADQVGINQQKADQVQQQNIAKNRALGRVPDENNPGVYRGMTPDEILADPVLSKKQDLAQAAALQKNAETALAQARTDALIHSDSPTLALKARQIEATLEMAKANLVLRQHALSNQDAGLAIRRGEMRMNYGMDDLGNVLANENAAPGMIQSPDGQPVPYKLNTFYGPTANMRTRGQMGASMPVHIAEMQNLIHQAAQQGYVGPASGRVYQDYLAGRVGSTGDPQADELLGQLNSARTFLASGVNVMHYGGRGGQDSYDKFEKMLGTGASEENLNGALHEISSYGENYAKSGTPKTVRQGAQGANAPASGASAPAAPGAVPSFVDWKKSQGGK